LKRSVAKRKAIRGKTAGKTNGRNAEREAKRPEAKALQKWLRFVAWQIALIATPDYRTDWRVERQAEDKSRFTQLPFG